MNVTQFNLTFYLSIYSGETSFASKTTKKLFLFPHVYEWFALAAGLTAAAVVFGYTRCFIIFHKLVRSAQHLHDSMFNAVIRTSVHFFDVNPIGEPSFQIILHEPSRSPDTTTLKSL